MRTPEQNKETLIQLLEQLLEKLKKEDVSVTHLGGSVTRDIEEMLPETIDGKYPNLKATGIIRYNLEVILDDSSTNETE